MEYQHGGDIYSQKVDLDFSANINPLGLPEAVARAAADSLKNSGAYPDSRCSALVHALAGFHQVPDGWIVCGNGAADLIFGLALAVKPAKALVTAPAFSEYEQALRAVGSHVDYLDLREEDGFSLDIKSLVAKLDGGTEMFFLCNPNNPTGIPIRREIVGQIAALCGERGVLLVVDECFCDFLARPEEYSVIPRLGSCPNVFVLKAFTKLYAMAGLRLGYGICSDSGIMEAVARVRQPWSVSNVAQAAGLAALGETEYVKRSTAVVGEERKWMSGQLSNLGFKVYDSGANYIFFRDVRKEAAAADGRGLLYGELLRRGILIRSCANYRGLDCTCYRVCVKRHGDNLTLIRAIEQAVRGHENLKQQKERQD